PMVEVAFRWSFDLDNQIVQQKSPPPQPLTSKSACTPLSTIAPADDVHVIPIILEKSDHFAHSVLARFNALPRKGKPVRDTSPQRNAFYEIEVELGTIFANLKSNRDLRQKQVLFNLGKRRRLEGE
ncbi:MAG: hypothetical protein WBX11_17225, partial [Thiobacillaceae bacterium]